jgi:RNA polymerase sigma-70 factor (ECF subfamily)
MGNPTGYQEAGAAKIVCTNSRSSRFSLIERMRALALETAAAPTDGPDDRLRLAAAARAGDLAAFELLMRQYERLVLVTALRLLGNMEDAQDASQEVFLKLYRNLRKLERAGNLTGWLYRVTVNVCHDSRRRRAGEAPVEEAGEAPDQSADPRQILTDAERRRALAMSLRQLSERERAAVTLRDLEGLSTQEAALAMGVNEATVRSHISQARVKMRGFLERYMGRRS